MERHTMFIDWMIQQSRYLSFLNWYMNIIKYYLNSMTFFVAIDTIIPKFIWMVKELEKLK